MRKRPAIMWTGPWCDKNSLIWINCKEEGREWYTCLGVEPDDCAVYYVFLLRNRMWAVSVYQGNCCPGAYDTAEQAKAVVQRFYEDRASGRYNKADWAGNGKGGKHRTISLPDDFEGRHEREWPKK